MPSGALPAHGPRWSHHPFLSGKGPYSMSESTRRNFLIASGASAAAVGVAAALPGTASAAAVGKRTKPAQRRAAGRPCR